MGRHSSVLTWMGFAKRPDALEAASEPQDPPAGGSGVDYTTSLLADCRVGGHDCARSPRRTRSASFGKVQNDEIAPSCNGRPPVDNRIPALWIAAEGSLMAYQDSATGEQSPRKRMTSSKRLKAPKKPAPDQSREPSMDFEKPGGTLGMAHFLKTTGPPALADVKAERRKQRIPSPIYFLRHRKDQDQTASESVKARLSYPPESVVQKISKAGTKYLHIVTENPDDESLVDFLYFNSSNHSQIAETTDI